MSAHTANTELKLIGKLILEGELHCETGLHIGAGKGSLEIGGADNPVVKDAFGRPYVPGQFAARQAAVAAGAGLAAWPSPSELVYLSRRKGQEVRIHQSDRPDDEICLLFGRNPGRMERVRGRRAGEQPRHAARLTVYDAPLDLESITPQMRENLDDELTEVKSENAIDRITSQANPRTLERVPAGARFRVRFVLDILCEEDKALAGAAGRRACGCSKTTRSAAAARAAAAGCASPTCGWPGAAAASMPRARRRRSCSPAPIWRRCRRW